MFSFFAYIPEKESTDCPVYKFFSKSRHYLVPRFMKTHVSALVLSEQPKVLSYIPNRASKKLVCFGHKDKHDPVLKTAKGQRYLTYDWVDTDFLLGVFLVKNSDLLLRTSPDWAKRFKHWVAFSEEFEIDIDRIDFITLQSKMYNAIKKVIQRSTTGEELKQRISSIYSKYIDLTYKKVNKKGIDVTELLLTVQNLKANKNAIAHG